MNKRNVSNSLNCLAIYLFFLASANSWASDFSLVDKNSGLPVGDILAIVADSRGAWVGAGSGVARVSRTRGLERSYGPSDGLPGGRIFSLALFQEKVYAGSESGLAVLDGNRWRVFTKADRFSLSNCFLRTEPGGKWLWVAAVNTNGGLLRFDGEKWEFLGGEGRGPLNNVRTIAFEGDSAWLGTLGSGVYHRTGAGIRYFKTRDGLPASTVGSIEAFGGAVWAGTSKGLARFENGRWGVVAGSPLPSVSAMAASPTSLFVGGPNGLFRYRSGTFHPVTFGESAGGETPVTALAYSDGVLYAGTPRGLAILKEGQ